MDAQFYVFGATVSDADLDFQKLPGQVFHTAQDDALARAIAAELNQRGVNPGPFEGPAGTLASNRENSMSS